MQKAYRTLLYKYSLLVPSKNKDLGITILEDGRWGDNGNLGL